MIVCLSPYHVTTRELPLMVAPVLGEHAVTILPVPPGGEDEDTVRGAIASNPAYERLLERWRWLCPLFREGVIRSLGDGRDAILDARTANDRYVRDERWRPMRPLLHPDLFGAEERYLERLSEDLLKGGPDPGICVPIVAGLDAMAAARGWCVLRAGGEPGGAHKPSVAQRAEARLGATICSFTIPVMSSCGAQAVLDLRASLGEELSRLRQALTRAIVGEADVRTLRQAASVYAQAYERWRGAWGGDDTGVRVTDQHVSVIARRVPSDAAMTSSLAALRHVSGVSVPATAPGGTDPGLVTLTIGAMTVTPG